MTVTERDARCPHCGRENQLHQGRPGTWPKPGDVGICWDCRGLMVFTEHDPRLPTREEMAEFRTDPDIRQMLHAMREAYTPTQAVRLTWPDGR